MCNPLQQRSSRTFPTGVLDGGKYLKSHWNAVDKRIYLEFSGSNQFILLSIGKSCRERFRRSLAEILCPAIR